MTKPVLKWVGGKRQLLPELLLHIPQTFGTYHEPFIGGGALFFELSGQGKISQAYLSDANPELINFYQTLRDDFAGLCIGLQDLAKNHVNEHDFYNLRASYEGYTDTGRAALLLYFNKTAFNGLMRQNQSGKWNMPWGYYAAPTVYDEPALRAANQALKSAAIYCQDFEQAIRNANQGDLVYCDPPYVPVSKTASFTGYSKGGFSMKDQERLIAEANLAVNRGVKVIISNADSPTTRQLYGLYSNFIVHSVSARRAVNCKADKRGSVGELVVVSK